jgi:AbrB family looped-hinge helix DNA binding protein
MKEFESSVSPKGQITLPLEVRRRWGLKAKDRVAIRIDEDQVIIAPAAATTPAPSTLDAIYQSVPALAPPRPWREVTRLAADEHAHEAAREGLSER